MASVLADTSVWVDYFRKGESPASLLLDLLLKEKKVVLCGVVELELLQGMRPAEKEPLSELLTALPCIETERSDFKRAGELLRDLRAKGVQIPATDGIIAALCGRHGFSLLTLDKHFEHFPDIKKLKTPHK
jgi:predicted nucleic acid-binding protein